MTDPEILETVDPEEAPEFLTQQEPKFTMGLTDFGKIGLNITDTNGTTVGYVVETPVEAWEIAGHLLAIATMMVQGFYAVAAQEKQQIAKLMAEQNKKVWTPS